MGLEGGRLLVHGGLDAAERRLDDAWVFDTVKYASLLAKHLMHMHAVILAACSTHKLQIAQQPNALDFATALQAILP